MQDFVTSQNTLDFKHFWKNHQMKKSQEDKKPNYNVDFQEKNVANMDCLVAGYMNNM